ncbi:hypothetical protein RJ640_027746 [Escallonia rubra]|uniref:Retroviral polymerase SH3-like domain-containing protein n=1 Tax=Escallonia rubra TaxID=112253 RepID=A0AA88QTF8_9ASTE|nr:hypothetical protein RJ640_027746 [Escallonia rubra]
MQIDLIGQFDELPTCKVLWDLLKLSSSGTSTTRLRNLVIKFEENTKDPKHTMNEHLRVMSNMIDKLKDVGHALTDEQQVRVVIRSLPTSWANMKHILTHSEDIKNFSDVSQHAILEAETRDADKTLTYVAQGGSRNANGKRRRQSKKAKKDEASTYVPKEGKIKKRKRGKRGATKYVVRDRESTSHKYGKLGPRAKKSVFLRYFENSKGYVMYGEYPNGGKTKVESRDVNFIESDFPSIGDASKNLDLHELKKVEATLPSLSKGGKLVPHPVVAEVSISDPQHSGSIPDSESTPPGPLGQQDSPLRRGTWGRVPCYCFKIDGEILMCTPTDKDEPTSMEEALSSSAIECEISGRHYESDWAEKLRPIVGVMNESLLRHCVSHLDRNIIDHVWYSFHLRLCLEEDTQCGYFSMYPWIIEDTVSQGMPRKAIESNWNDMKALGRKFNITPYCVIHSPSDFVDFHFDMSYEYITYERFNIAHCEAFFGMMYCVSLVIS